MARRITKRSKAILSSGLHPHYVSVAKTMARFTGDDLVYQTPRFESETDFPSLMEGIDKDTSCVVVQYPDILGRIKDLKDRKSVVLGKSVSVRVDSVGRRIIKKKK